MRTIMKQAISLVVMCLIVCSAPAASAFFGRSSRPLIVRFEGRLYPLDDNMVGGMDTITVAMQRKEYLFQASKVDVVGGARGSGTLLLSRLVPPRLLFSGPSDVISTLANPQNAGKPFTLNGWLYLVNRRFHVTELRGEEGRA